MNARWMRACCGLGLLCAFGCGDDDKTTEPAAQTGDGGLDAQQPSTLDATAATQDGNAVRAEAGRAFANAFAVRGHLLSAPGDKRAKAGGDAAVEHSITHVMAVNPRTANPVRYLQPVAADGSFAIGVDLNVPWVIVLVDAHAVGRDMVAGVFRAADFDLDSIAATHPGTLELGDVTVDDEGTASASIGTASLLSALGLSEATATVLGALDDVSLRYVNPDIDGDGKIDLEQGVRYGLDFHLRYTMSDGAEPIALSSLLNRFADPARTSARYGLGSAIASWDPMRFGVTSAADYRIRFPTASGSYAAPPAGGSFMANIWIELDGSFYVDAGPHSMGISFDATQPFPVGEYDFEIKGTQLSFTEVRTHDLAELNLGANLIVPFMQVDAPDANCSGWSCAVTGFDYQWMRRGESGWQPATAEEVALFVPAQGGYLSFQPAGATDKRLEYVIPGSPTSGTIEFSAAAHVTNVTAAEIAALTVGQLCHLGISYDDTLGMRMFQGWQTGPNCPP